MHTGKHTYIHAVNKKNTIHTETYMHTYIQAYIHTYGNTEQIRIIPDIHTERHI